MSPPDSGQQVDIYKAETVEVVVTRAHDGMRLWLHVDGDLRCRIYRIGRLILDDQRIEEDDQ